MQVLAQLRGDGGGPPTSMDRGSLATKCVHICIYTYVNVYISACSMSSCMGECVCGHGMKFVRA